MCICCVLNFKIGHRMVIAHAKAASLPVALWLKMNEFCPKVAAEARAFFAGLLERREVPFLPLSEIYRAWASDDEGWCSFRYSWYSWTQSPHIEFSRLLRHFLWGELINERADGPRAKHYFCAARIEQRGSIIVEYVGEWQSILGDGWLLTADEAAGAFASPIHGHAYTYHNVSLALNIDALSNRLAQLHAVSR